MESLLWIIAAIVIVQVRAQSGDMYMSPNMPSFYQGEQGTFTCQLQTNDQVPFDDVAGFGLKRTSLDGSGDVFYPQCSIEVVFGEPKKATAATNSRVSDQACEDAYQDLSDNGVATLQVNWDMQETGSYQCLVYSGSQPSVSDAVTRVEQLLVAPTSLTIMVNPEKVYAGMNVVISCQSEGGDPPANFEYSVNGEVVGNRIEPFEASPGDDGTRYRCTDLSHPNYNDKRFTSQRKIVDVYYLTATRENITETVNPKDSKSLRCATMSKLPEGEVLVYSWTKDGEMLTDDSEIAIAKQDANLNETLVEMYMCTVSVAHVNIEDVTVHFSVTWNPDSTTKAMTTTAKPSTKPVDKAPSDKTELKDDSNNTTTIVVVVVVVVTVIILIVVIAVVCYRKRNSHSENVTKEAGPVPAKSDAEKGTSDADAAAEPMLQEERERREKEADESGKQ